MADGKLTGYDLSRRFFDWSFENPELIRPIHSAIYFFAIEHKNRLGWKEKFGFPSQMVMEAIGIKKHQTYISAFNDLIKWGGFSLIEKSKNQYSANIISINAMPKNGKALDKAFIKHRAKHSIKHSQSTGQSTVDIDKQVNNEQINNNNIYDRKLKFASTLEPFLEIYGRGMLDKFYNYWSECNKSKTKMRFELEKTWELHLRLKKWASNNFQKNTHAGGGKQSITQPRELT